MATGDLINFANYKKNVRDGSSWTTSKSLQDTNRTIIAVGSSIRLEARVSSVLFRSNWVRVTGSYWNGSGWTTAFSNWEASKSGAGSASFSFNHNRETESTDSCDSPFHHIWKFDISMKGKDGSAHGYCDIIIGGIEMFTQNEYNEVCLGKKIQCCRPDWWEIGGTYATAEACVAGERPSAFRGNPISSSYRYMSASAID